MLSNTKTFNTINRLEKALLYIRNMPQQEIDVHYYKELSVKKGLLPKSDPTKYVHIYRIYDEIKNEIIFIPRNKIFSSSIKSITIPWLFIEDTNSSIKIEDYRQYLIKNIEQYKNTAYSYFLDNVSNLIDKQIFYEKLILNYVSIDDFLNKKTFTFVHFMKLISKVMTSRRYVSESYEDDAISFIKKIISFGFNLSDIISNSIPTNENGSYVNFLQIIRYYNLIDNSHDDNYYIDLLKENKLISTGNYYGEMPLLNENNLSISFLKNYLSHIYSYSSIPDEIDVASIQKLIIDTLDFNVDNYEEKIFIKSLLTKAIEDPSITFSFTKQVKEQITSIVKDDNYTSLMEEQKYFMDMAINPIINLETMKNIINSFYNKFKKA